MFGNPSKIPPEFVFPRMFRLEHHSLLALLVNHANVGEERHKTVFCRAVLLYCMLFMKAIKVQKELGVTLYEMTLRD
jgi:hypothetical protein